VRKSLETFKVKSDGDSTNQINPSVAEIININLKLEHHRKIHTA
jgi:hypothetical protein